MTHKSKREIEQILAARFPQPDIEDSIDPTSLQRQSVDPLAEGRYAVSFTATERCSELLERAKELTSHRRPRPGFGELIEAALEAYVEKLEKQKFKTTDRPREGSSAGQSEDPRYIPARVKREVYHRDGGRCTFVATNERRCRARAFIEYDHVVPVARGGTSTPDNLRLRCFRHNQHGAVEEFGEVYMSLTSSGFQAARVTANRAALLAMRPLDIDPRGSPTRSGTSGAHEGTAQSAS